MQAILGVDAAWTSGAPSGVALLQGEGNNWKVVRVAPSYGSFLDCCSGKAVDWNASSCQGAEPPVAELLEAARTLAGADLAIVAVDMPVATADIVSRRAADRAISQTFGGRGCAAHSPNAKRPGKLGAGMMTQLASNGFPLATTLDTSQCAPCTIEVYPHPALLALLQLDYRHCYKVSRSSRYWEGASITDRIHNLMTAFCAIAEALKARLGDLTFSLPDPTEVRTLSQLKRYEDALDALICAWVGLQFVQGQADAFGDHTAAVWVPCRPENEPREHASRADR